MHCTALLVCARYIPVLCYFCVQCAIISLPEISATFLLQLIELNQSINFQFSRTISDKYKFLVMPVGWTRPLKPFYVGFFFSLVGAVCSVCKCVHILHLYAHFIYLLFRSPSFTWSVYLLHFDVFFPKKNTNLSWKSKKPSVYSITATAKILFKFTLIWS